MRMHMSGMLDACAVCIGAYVDYMHACARAGVRPHAIAHDARVVPPRRPTLTHPFTPLTLTLYTPLSIPLTSHSHPNLSYL